MIATLRHKEVTVRPFIENQFTPQHITQWKIATRIVEAFPQLAPVDDLRCHEVARVVGTLLELEVVDGNYGGGDHSWCVLDPLPHADCILDPYAIYRIPPVQLIFLPYWALFSTHYRVESARTDIRQDIIDEALRHLAPRMSAWKLEAAP